MSREEAYSLTSDSRQLQRLPGGGYSQGRALHDPQVDLLEEVAIPRQIANEEILFGPSLVARLPTWASAPSPPASWCSVPAAL